MSHIWKRERVVNFLVSPPEIISSHIFTGAGPGPLLAAAVSWQGLSAELQTAASSFGSLTSTLAGGPWQGAASVAMMTAAARHVQWLTAAAAKAQESSAQAIAAVSAFEVAQAATVHPAAVAANRAQFLSLASSNLFGQNAPAIAAAEAQYAQMWAQDVGAMVGYHAAASAAASNLPSFVEDLLNTVQGIGQKTLAIVEAVSNIGSGNTGGFNLGSNNNGWFNVGAGNAGYFNSGVGNKGWFNWGISNSGVLNLLALDANGWLNPLSIGANGWGNLLSLGNTGYLDLTFFNPTGPGKAVTTITTLLTTEDPLSWAQLLNIPKDLTGGVFGLGYPNPGLNNLPLVFKFSGGKSWQL